MAGTFATSLLNLGFALINRLCPQFYLIFVRNRMKSKILTLPDLSFVQAFNCYGLVFSPVVIVKTLYDSRNIGYSCVKTRIKMNPDFIQIRYQIKELAKVLSLIFIQLPHHFFFTLAFFLIHFMFQVGKPPVSFLHAKHSLLATSQHF